MKAQRRQQADDGSRVFARHLGQGGVFRDRSIRKCVQATSYTLELSLPNQAGQGNGGQPALSQIAWSNESPLCGEF